MIPGLRLRNTAEAERLGMDEVEIGEFATDYIEIRRDFTDGMAPFDSDKREPLYAAGDRHGHPDVERQQRAQHVPNGFDAGEKPASDDQDIELQPRHSAADASTEEGDLHQRRVHPVPNGSGAHVQL